MYIPYIFLKTTCSIHIIVFVCMFSGFIIWHWAANSCAPPWGGPSLPLPSFLT